MVGDFYLISREVIDVTYLFVSHLRELMDSKSYPFFILMPKNTNIYIYIRHI